MTPAPGLPRWVYVPAAIGAALIVLPLLALVVKADWGQFPALVTSPASQAALLLSVRTCLASTALCLLFGVPLAVVLARGPGRMTRLLRPMILLPLVLPPVVGGIALLYAFGKLGLLGHYLDAAGIRIAYSTSAVVLAQTFVSLPFLVISLQGALTTTGQRYDEVAASLGAPPTTVLRRVSLPLVMPALASGTVLAFARSLGEFGATLTFAGSRQGGTRTLPLEIYLQRESDPQAAVALSLLLVAVAAVVLAVVGARTRRPAGGGYE
ncbi:ABC transporter permease [Mycobacteroides abscessus]|uniref:ABC transporter permease n=1 Tax=Mycobacteroides abscessus TaxID=36809 RepID=UPI0005E35F86|nr:ABC transporter permease [Mycobacteroides abscessus]CPY32137.1 Molybdenum ABC transporter ModB%2C permease [Mycobacteroides abscessus]